MVGHLDLKFQLDQQCSTPPDIQVTLYKQKVSTFAKKVEEVNAEVDRKINFKLPSEEEKENKGREH